MFKVLTQRFCIIHGKWLLLVHFRWLSTTIVLTKIERKSNFLEQKHYKIPTSLSTYCSTKLTQSIIGDNLAAAILAESNLSWIEASLARRVL